MPLWFIRHIYNPSLGSLTYRTWNGSSGPSQIYVVYMSYLFETRFSRQAEIFLVFLPYEPRMFLKCFLINQVQITIPMIPMFLCSCAQKKKEKKKRKVYTPTLLRRFNSYRKCRWSHLHTKNVDSVLSLKSKCAMLWIVVFWRYFLSKIV